MLTNAPPPVPPTRKCEPYELEEHLAVWVKTGTAHFRLPDGAEHRVEAGTGIWLPPGVDDEVWTEPGTVAVPIGAPSHLLAAASGRVVHFAVAREAHHPLIAHYGRRTPDGHTGFGHPSSPLGDLGALVGRIGHPSTAAAPPPRPRRGPAGRVAGELTCRPALDNTLEEWAAWAACSPSTLRRGFKTQTGLTFAEWRHLHRLASAAERLAAGRRVGEVAAEVGYASRWGFSAAFRAIYSVPPREFTGSDRAAAHASTPTPAADGEPAPAGTTLDYNVMLWVRAGVLQATFGGSRVAGCAGEVVWLPAGTVIDHAPESAVPLSTLCTQCIQLGQVERARFPPSWNDWLLWASVSTNSLLRHEHHHGYAPPRQRLLHDHVIDAFTAQVAVERARTVPMPADDRARTAADAFMQALGTARESSTHHVPAEVDQAFRRETGMSFARWRHAARMRTARQMLQAGTASSNVATRVGYSLLSNFSRAFTRFHGIGPREFQALEGTDDHMLAG